MKPKMKKAISVAFVIFIVIFLVLADLAVKEQKTL